MGPWAFRRATQNLGVSPAHPVSLSLPRCGSFAQSLPRPVALPRPRPLCYLHVGVDVAERAACLQARARRPLRAELRDRRRRIVLVHDARRLRMEMQIKKIKKMQAIQREFLSLTHMGEQR